MIETPIRYIARMTTEATKTEVGSYFVSNYPPFSTWTPENVPKAIEALDSAPEPSTPLGLYLHIPFCTVICTSCPYNKVPTRNDLVEQYLKALRREIETYARNPYFQGVTFTAAAFGGGTPTALRTDQIADVLGDLPYEEVIHRDNLVVLE